MKNKIKQTQNSLYYICQNSYCKNEWSCPSLIEQAHCINCGTDYIWKFNNIKEIQIFKNSNKNSNWEDFKKDEDLFLK